MEVEAVKAVTALSLFALCLVAGVAPSALATWGRRHVVSHTTSYLVCMVSCGAGGVFLGTLLLHLLPEVRHLWEPALRDLRTAYPLPEFCVGLGFFAVFLLEEVVLVCWGKDAHGHDLAEVVAGERRHVKEHHAPHHHHHHQIQPPEETSFLSPGGYGSASAGHDVPRDGASTAAVLARARTTCHRLESSESACLLTSCPEMTLPPASHTDTATVSKLRTGILLLSLSFHSVFEGLALGLSAEADAVLSLFVGLAAHKATIALTVGVQLWAAYGSVARSARYMFVLAIMTPVGAGIGMWVSGGAGSDAAAAHQSLPVVVLQGVAAGTFLYVTFFEILHHEMENEKPGLLKLLAVLLGFSLIAAFHLLPAYSHGHGTATPTPADSARDQHR